MRTLIRPGLTSPGEQVAPGQGWALPAVEMPVQSPALIRAGFLRDWWALYWVAPVLSLAASAKSLTRTTEFFPSCLRHQTSITCLIATDCLGNAECKMIDPKPHREDTVLWLKQKEARICPFILNTVISFTVKSLAKTFTGGGRVNAGPIELIGISERQIL